MQSARQIKLLILDVDGVLTDGGIILDGGRGEYKKFNVRDGHGIRLLIEAGIEVAILTGRDSKVVQRRARELGIKEVCQGSHEKLASYEKIKGKLGLPDSRIAYLGDDIVDIPVFRKVRLAVAVADAHEEAKKHAHYITKTEGGKGAAREVAEMLLKAQGHWDDVIIACCKD